MIITPEVIFIHVPKTGGQSIGHAMFGNVDKYYLHLANHQTGEFHKDENPHIKASEIRAFVGDEYYDNAVKFTVVRHPLDRLLSFYHYGLNRIKKGVFSSFDEFVRFAIGEIEKPDAGWAWQNARQTMSDQLDDDIDHFLRFETLPFDYKAFAKLHGIPEILPHLNKSEFKPENLNNFTRQKAMRYFEKDFKRFNYR
jgi:hypothetical protein